MNNKDVRVYKVNLVYFFPAEVGIRLTYESLLTERILQFNYQGSSRRRWRITCTQAQSLEKGYASKISSL